jgi:PAS domain S-box-containing protein
MRANESTASSPQQSGSGPQKRPPGPTPAQVDLQTLFETLQVGVVIQSASSEIIRCNEKALELLGLTRDQLLGKTSFDPSWNVIHEDGSAFPGNEHPVAVAIQTRQPVRDVVMGVSRPEPQERVWLLVNATPQLAADGSVSHAVCTFVDITEQKRREQVQREQEERLALAVRGGGVGLWDFRLGDQRVIVNDQWNTMLGRGPADGPPTHAQWRSLVHPDDLPRLLEFGDALLKDPSPRVHEVEIRVRHADGHYIWIGNTAMVVERGPDGSPVRVAGCHRDISRRKQLEEHERELRRQLTRIIEHAPVPMAVSDSGGRLTLLNRAFVQTFGYTADQIPTLEAWRMKAYPDPRYRQEIVSRRLALIAGASRAAEEIQITCADGTVRDILANVIPLSPEVGDQLSVLYDITERTRAQAERIEQERFIIEAVEKFPGQLAYWDRNLRCKIANPAYFQWFNRTLEDVMRMDYRQWLGEDLFAKNQKCIEATLRGETQSFERTTVRWDGAEVHALVSYIPRIYHGEVVGFFVSVTDVTSIRRDQDQLRVSDIALNSISQGVVIADREQRVIWCNRAASAISGYSEAELLGKNCNMLQGSGTDPRTVEAMHAALSEGREFSGAVLNYRKDGTPFWNEMTITPLRGETGAVSHFVGVTRDITERMRAQELQVQLHQAQKLESIGRLAGGVAHDFNNMLSVILGQSEIALRRSDLAEPARESLCEIHKAAERSAQLTRQLMTFARQQHLRGQALDINQAVRAISQMIERLVGGSIHIEWRLDASPAIVWLDASQLDQILINLCLNAKDAISGAGRILVRTGNRHMQGEPPGRPGRLADGDYITLTVADTGCGMDAATQKRMFEPFFTTKEVGKGTGLGLATVYGIVTQAGGEIDVQSEPGQGTLMTLLLPVPRN